MVDRKITDHTELATQPATSDWIEIVDVSDTTDAATGTNKKISRANLIGTVLDATTASFTTADETKLDGIETGATADLTEEEIQDSAWNVLTGTQTGITVTYQDGTNDVDFVVGGLTTTEFASANISQWTNDSGYITATLTNEEVQDIVGGMLTGNTETLITVTYQDADGTIDFVVDNDLSNYDNSTSSFITDVTGDNLSALADVTITSIVSGELLKWNGSAWINNTLAEADLLAASNNLSDVTASTARTNLGLVIGTDVQAYSSVLANTTASFTTADEIKLDGIEALADVTDATNVAAAGGLIDTNNLSDLDNASTARTNLGLGTIATQSSTNVNIDGGNIDGTTIGAATQAAGSFTSVTADQGSGIIVGTDTIGDYTKVTLSSADILALHTTPITLLTAPGANKIVVPEQFVMWYDYGTAAYAGIAASENLRVGYNGGSDIAIIETIGFIDQTNDEYRVALLYSPITINLPVLVNTALEIDISGAVTTGDGTLKIKTYYKIVDLTDF